ncbi:response regulator [Cesiribacter sp. SM1]|uniref:response regulator n=1 Tax=Cesiribacter sp. SM1 TaxID=2861196 RepID=UPI001CD759E5|nr:response regulator [Cesiribacter sp. SM1]
MSVAIYNTVWLIDDDELANYVNEKIISSQHFAKSTVVFTTVDEAVASLDLAAGQKGTGFPDIVFLDMEMPGLDGWDFIEAFQRLSPDVKKQCKLYMLSSSIDKSDAERAMAYEDICCFISKPLTTDVLQTIMDSKPGSSQS